MFSSAVALSLHRCPQLSIQHENSSCGGEGALKNLRSETSVFPSVPDSSRPINEKGTEDIRYRGIVASIRRSPGCRCSLSDLKTYLELGAREGGREGFLAGCRREEPHCIEMVRLIVANNCCKRE